MRTSRHASPAGLVLSLHLPSGRVVRAVGEADDLETEKAFRGICHHEGAREVAELVEEAFR